MSGNTLKAAQLVFSRRFSEYQYTISGLESPHKITVNESAVTINCELFCLQFLRTFGDSIKKLQLEYLSGELFASDLMEAKILFNEKCTKALTELKLVNCEEEIFASFDEVFENVTNLRISCSSLGKCMDLGKWFPKLEHLELMHNKGCVQVVSCFPHLSYLAMDTEGACMTTGDIEAIIKSAPKVNTLSLSDGVSASLLQFITEQMPDLKHLRLWEFHLSDEPEELAEEIISYPSIESLYISTGLLGFLPLEIPFKFDNLKELQVITESVGEEWFNFALAHSNLVKLHLDSIWHPEIFDDDLTQIAIHLTKLQELDVIADVSPDGLEQFLMQCESLKKIRIRNFEMDDFEMFNGVGRSKWEITQRNRGVTFERRQ